MEDSNMKKALLIIALLFASARIHASHAGSELHIRMFDNSWFTVVDIPASSDVRAMVDRSRRFRINRVEPLYACEPVITQPVCNMPPVVPVIHCMDDYAFGGLMNTLRNMSFESSRMTVAKNAIMSNNFTSRQVADMMGLMTFDSSRLELAKFAYNKTIDRENYWVVYDLFAFESSIVELNNYISRA